MHGEPRNNGFKGRSNYNGDFKGRNSNFGGKNPKRDNNSFSDSNYNGGFKGRNSNFGGNNAKRDNNSFAGANLKPVDFKTAQLPPLKKNIYNESSVIKSRSQSEVTKWLNTNQVNLSGENVPRPVFEFSESGFPEKIIDQLYGNYEHPTVIQSISWPVALSGRDMISIAKTGSGKTLGFLLPGIMHILNQKRVPGKGPTVLVMLPTRELAQQVAEVCKEYCTAMRLRYVCLFGGASKGPQARDLSYGVDVCIATPGRLLDFIESNATTMSRCSFLVLDEADRMLDMGFEPQIRKIVSQIRPDRQTLMFSATWPKEVRNLARDFQTDPVFLNVGSMDLAANHNIEQHVEVIDEEQKQERLFHILDKALKEEDAKIIIFVSTKRTADELTRNMRRDGWPALCIHGDKEQRERNWVLNEFKSGNVPVLLATDVAARGLDVDNIKVVINYDYSNNSEDYVHRIGRTGRRDNKGVAYTFFTKENAAKARDLIKILEEAKQEVPQQLRSMAHMSGGKGRGNYGRFRGNGRFGGKRSATFGEENPAKRTRFDENGFAAPRW